MDKNIARDLLVRALDDMEEKALAMKVQGVGVACFLDKKSQIDWIGEMKVVEHMRKVKSISLHLLSVERLQKKI
jgi:hypothetical protein